MAPTRPKQPPRKPEPDVGLQLDRELNDQDIYVVEIGGKDKVGKKSTIEKLKGIGKVKMRFINGDGRNCEHFIKER